MIRAVTVSEPRFTRDDVDLVLASRLAELKSPTGHPLDEATASEANPANPNGTYYYRAIGETRANAAPPHVDWALRAQRQAEERWRKENPDVDASGYFWPVERVERK